jgi:hypothetical protein
MTDRAAQHLELHIQTAGRRSRIVELLSLGTDIRENEVKQLRSPQPTTAALRVAQRLGLDVLANEPKLLPGSGPPTLDLARLLDGHGRKFCKRVNPKCHQCVLRSFCANALPATKPDARPTFVELFAGAGGLGLGFVQAGYHVLAAFERDRDAAQTYRLNHPGTHVIETDVRFVDADVLSRLGLTQGIVDVLIAGRLVRATRPQGEETPQTRSTDFSAMSLELPRS